MRRDRDKTVVKPEDNHASSQARVPRQTWSLLLLLIAEPRDRALKRLDGFGKILQRRSLGARQRFESAPRWSDRRTYGPAWREPAPLTPARARAIVGSRRNRAKYEREPRGRRWFGRKAAAFPSRRGSLLSDKHGIGVLQGMDPQNGLTPACQDFLTRDLKDSHRFRCSMRPAARPRKGSCREPMWVVCS